MSRNTVENKLIKIFSEIQKPQEDAPVQELDSLIQPLTEAYPYEAIVAWALQTFCQPGHIDVTGRFPSSIIDKTEAGDVYMSDFENIIPSEDQIQYFRGALVGLIQATSSAIRFDPRVESTVRTVMKAQFSNFSNFIKSVQLRRIYSNPLEAIDKATSASNNLDFIATKYEKLYGTSNFFNIGKDVYRVASEQISKWAELTPAQRKAGIDYRNALFLKREDPERVRAENIYIHNIQRTTPQKALDNITQYSNLFRKSRLFTGGSALLVGLGLFTFVPTTLAIALIGSGIVLTAYDRHLRKSVIGSQRVLKKSYLKAEEDKLLDSIKEFDSTLNLVSLPLIIIAVYEKMFVKDANADNYAGLFIMLKALADGGLLYYANKTFLQIQRSIQERINNSN